MISNQILQNTIEGITTIDSCCGHGSLPLRITIQFSRLQSLALLIKVIYTYFKEDFIVSTNPYVCNNKLDRVLLDLCTVTVGEEAYKKATELAEKLTKWAKVLY